MAIITQSIGSSGRDFATPQAWWDATPANFVTAGNSYVGECYADSEFTGTTILLNAVGKTTDATHTATLKAASGQSGFSRSNALRYNAANGVAITSSVVGGGTGGTILIQNNYVTLEGLQIQNTAPAGQFTVVVNTSVTAGFNMRNCLVFGSGRVLEAEFGTFDNCVFQLIGGSGSANMVALILNAAALNFNYCDFVSGSDVGAPTFGVYGVNSTINMKNCAIFGFGAAASGDGSETYAFTTSMTDATGTTGLTGGITYANQFVNTTDAAGDWRAKAGATLENAGTTVGGITTDISGFTRSGTPTIGVWELAVASAAKQSSVTVISG